jgi:hypothetical protein
MALPGYDEISGYELKRIQPSQPSQVDMNPPGYNDPDYITRQKFGKDFYHKVAEVEDQYWKKEITDEEAIESIDNLNNTLSAMLEA